MTIPKIKVPPFSGAELNPKIVALFEIIQQQGEQLQALRDEVARLKGHKPKPKIKPSGMDQETSKRGKGKKGKRAGSKKRGKTKDLTIHKTIIIPADSKPTSSEFKGYNDYVVQGIKIKAENILYRLERWKTPDGSYLEGQLPAHVDGHFSAELRAYILYQHNQCHVTQPRLRESLLEFGIDISAGQLDRILSEGHEAFHREKDEILTAALETSDYVQVDDTGARHQGKNGYCMVICNGSFTWFASTGSKSRINFLQLLQGSHEDYVINEEAVRYMTGQKLAKGVLKQTKRRRFKDEAAWEKYLQTRPELNERHKRILTEGALVGSLFEHGFNPELVILSDDAGQFNILLHALCWIHAERLIHKIVGFNEDQTAAVGKVRGEIWDLYRGLKAYQERPSQKKRAKLEKLFDRIFTQKTCFATLNCALKRLYKNKAELLLVLKRPEIPLHNNTSETDAREYVTRRKVSGGTRHDRGRKARDTFTSLKKTCRKQEISFWQYLLDRISSAAQIPYLPHLIQQNAGAG